MPARETFLTELTEMQRCFNAMAPEMEVTLRDPRCGVEGFVTVWNTGISQSGPLPGCAKGGTRIRPGLTATEITALARTMALKNAAAGLPLGGCKSGLNADHRADNFERCYRRFVELCKPLCYENGGAFGGFGFDIGAAPEHVVWACDSLSSTRWFTGKPVAMGGTDYDREGIAGLGVAESATALLRHHQRVIPQTRFTVHGVGAMGAAVIRYFLAAGAQLQGIGDPKYRGTWQFKKPPSLALVQALIHNDVPVALQNLQAEAEFISADANGVLYLDTDVLFPCALQHAINANNARDIRARYIIEGANNPTELPAYDTLFQRGIFQVPDFIANCGGIIAAFVELTSTVSDAENRATAAKVDEAKRVTKTTIRRNIQRIMVLADHHGVSLRDAALSVALQAIVEGEGGQ